ncbi:unnamed protein product [Thlaspi arvense]|uniref:Uncharacterized protein n=1 Tax=Thlaspi arvense TaxID=13288 RepID=A0AAU9SF87_THLAR|nr:unnamed protein product [Thlaspi arvense]
MLLRSVQSIDVAAAGNSHDHGGARPLGAFLRREIRGSRLYRGRYAELAPPSHGSIGSAIRRAMSLLP